MHFLFRTHHLMCQIESFKEAKWHVEGGECVWSCPLWLACTRGVTLMLFSAHSSHKGFIASPQSQCVRRLPKHRREEGERTQHELSYPPALSHPSAPSHPPALCLPPALGGIVGCFRHDKATGASKRGESTRRRRWTCTQQSNRSRGGGGSRRRRR